MKKIQYSSQVSLAYQLLLEDGSEVEASASDEPLQCVIGDGTLTDGMEQALLDRQPGDSIQVTLSPDQGYGYPDAENIHNMPVADFPAELKPEPGQLIAFDGPDDEEIVGSIVEIRGDEVAVDFSHPLAGRTLIFKADILDVTDPE
jgi:FKBP-type peptidyl-prolyl cis-trans isomerase 2